MCNYLSIYSSIYGACQLFNQKNILMGEDVQYDMIIDSYYWRRLEMGDDSSNAGHSVRRWENDLRITEMAFGTKLPLLQHNSRYKTLIGK